LGDNVTIMTDDHTSSDFDDAAEKAALPSQDESVDIAWGLVAFIGFLALLTVFVVQNGSTVSVEFLWLNIRMRLWVLLLVTVLLTLTFDQVVSLLYRRRKRQSRRTTEDHN
jgi:uncharacterized integral membrane protein